MIQIDEQLITGMAGKKEQWTDGRGEEEKKEEKAGGREGRRKKGRRKKKQRLEKKKKISTHSIHTFLWYKYSSHDQFQAVT